VTRIAFYRVSLALPIVAPFIALALAAAGSELAALALVPSAAGMYFIIVPYVVATATLLWWSRGRSADQFRKVAVWLPLITAPIAGIAVARHTIAESETVSQNFLLGFVTCLVLGYVYVGVVLFADALLYGERRNSAT
jgi:Na+-translocating ferredoxin:NAD+ oxidoreductase RnfA subunit